jgi:hypothetical protein
MIVVEMRVALLRERDGLKAREVTGRWLIRSKRGVLVRKEVVRAKCVYKPTR